MSRFAEDLQGFIFGDSEIDLVSFIGNGVRLNFNNQHGKPMVILSFYDVEYIIIESNHMQNVISEVSFFENVSNLLLWPPAQSFCQSKKAEIDNVDEKLKAVYIRPISGFEAVILFAEGEVLGLPT